MKLGRDSKRLRLDHVYGQLAVVQCIRVRHIRRGDPELVRHKDNVDDAVDRRVPIRAGERREVVVKDCDHIRVCIRLRKLLVV